MVGEQAAVNTPAGAVNSSVNGADVFTKMPEAEARSYIRSFREGQRSVRQLAEDTGWSVGWVSARLQEVRDAAREFESVEAVV